MGTARPSRLIPAHQAREGDEVAFSTRTKFFKVAKVDRNTAADPDHLTIHLANGNSRTFLLSDLVVRLDPKPDTLAMQKKGRP